VLPICTLEASVALKVSTKFQVLSASLPRSLVVKTAICIGTRGLASKKDIGCLERGEKRKQGYFPL